MIRKLAEILNRPTCEGCAAFGPSLVMVRGEEYDSTQKVCQVQNSEIGFYGGNFLDFVYGLMDAALSGHIGKTCPNSYNYVQHIFPKIEKCQNCPAAKFNVYGNIDDKPIFRFCRLHDLANTPNDGPDGDIIQQQTIDLFGKVLTSGHIYNNCAAGFEPSDFGYGETGKNDQLNLQGDSLDLLT